MKIILTGSTGQLGKEIIKSVPGGIHLICPSKKELNLLDFESCVNFIKNTKPNWLINAAAFTNVQEAQSHRDLAFKINGEAPVMIANTLNKYGGKMLHISTDYVFDGNEILPYKINSRTNPLNIYGSSKEFAELKLKQNSSFFNSLVILRTSWLMGSFGENFLTKILNNHIKNKEIRVINDQKGCFTSTTSLAKACWELIKKNEFFSSNNLLFPILNHWCDEGITTWFDIAVEIGIIGKSLGILDKTARIIPISSDDFISSVKRPKFSVLDCSTTEELISCKRLNWRKSLFYVMQDLIQQRKYLI